MDFLHNHSMFSDGRNSIMEMAECARSLGIRRFGISDHLVVLPQDGAVCDWSMKCERLEEYFSAVQEARSRLEDDSFRILAGLEFDYFRENYDALCEKLRSYPLDYVIIAVHYAGDFGIDDPECWRGLDEERRVTAWKGYLDKLLEVAGLGKRQIGKILAHLDLAKLYGGSMPESCEAELPHLLEAIASSGLTMEINLAGLEKPCHEQYPSEKIVSLARQLGIPMIVSGDCHSCENLERRWAMVKDVAGRLGLEERG